MMIKNIFFDLDGTLIDSEILAAEVINSTFLQWGHTILPADAYSIVGRTWDSAARDLFAKYALPQGLSYEKASRTLVDEYRKRLETQCIPVLGATAAVQALSRQYPLGLISGSHRVEIFYALDQLQIRNCFQCVLGAEDYPQSKPAPDGYLKALKEMGAKPEETLVFEDSEPGIESARRAGLWVYAITGAHRHPISVKDAHWVRKDFENFGIDEIRGLSPKKPG